MMWNALPPRGTTVRPASPWTVPCGSEACLSFGALALPKVSCCFGAAGPRCSRFPFKRFVALCDDARIGSCQTGPVASVEPVPPSLFEPSADLVMRDPAV